MWCNMQRNKVLAKRSSTLSPPSPPVTRHTHKGLWLPKTGHHEEIFMYGLIKVCFLSECLSMLWKGRRLSSVVLSSCTCVQERWDESRFPWSTQRDLFRTSTLKHKQNLLKHSRLVQRLALWRKSMTCLTRDFPFQLESCDCHLATGIKHFDFRLVWVGAFRFSKKLFFFSIFPGMKSRLLKMANLYILRKCSVILQNELKVLLQE